MALFSTSERRTAGRLAELAFSNPFLPRRVELEHEILGKSTKDGRAVMHRASALTMEETFPYLPELKARAEELATTARTRLVEGLEASDKDLELYQDVAIYVLYNRHMSDLDVTPSPDTSGYDRLWDEFFKDFRFFLVLTGRYFPTGDDPEHAFACLFQIRRAFKSIFDYITGASMPVARLRAAVWQSIFTHDLRRYSRTLFATLGNIPTLITGPSGTGKELVARAIALSRYIPFSQQTKHFEWTNALFYAANLSALAPTLVESELFGHVRGSFTGAVRDRKGRFEECDSSGTVFLDEIGDLDTSIQVKLLRVIQERRFQRLGETKDRTFHAKIIAATNRDLVEDMRKGRFREDLYYRLCGDVVTTPSLREQFDDAPEDLSNLVRFIVTHQLSIHDEAEREALTEEVVSLVHEKLPPDYAWPGNFRELEQCVRNVLIRSDYQPPVRREHEGAAQSLVARLLACSLSSDDLLTYYYTLVYERTGSFSAAAEVLGINWRTVRDKIDPERLRSLDR